MKTERLTTSDLLDLHAPLAAAVATHLSQGDEVQALDLLETDYADMDPLAAAALTDCDSGSVETPAPGATRHDLKEQAAAIVREADAEEMAQLLQDEAAVDAELETDRAADRRTTTMKLKAGAYYTLLRHGDDLAEGVPLVAHATLQEAQTMARAHHDTRTGRTVAIFPASERGRINRLLQHGQGLNRQERRDLFIEADYCLADNLLALLAD